MITSFYLTMIVWLLPNRLFEYKYSVNWFPLLILKSKVQIKSTSSEAWYCRNSTYITWKIEMLLRVGIAIKSGQDNQPGCSSSVFCKIPWFTSRPITVIIRIVLDQLKSDVFVGTKPRLRLLYWVIHHFLCNFTFHFITILVVFSCCLLWFGFLLAHWALGLEMMILVLGCMVVFAWR